MADWRAGSVYITSDHLWMFDGRGNCRCTLRAGISQPATDLDTRTITTSTWQPYESTSIEPYNNDWYVCAHVGTTDSIARIRIGPIIWTNAPINGQLLPYGPASPWFPVSGVPSDRDCPPDVLPFTAFGQFGPDRFDMRVFEQDCYWVDRFGTGHPITDMSEHYVTNVLAMLVDRCDALYGQFLVQRAFNMLYDTCTGRVNGDLLVGYVAGGEHDDIDSSVWLRSTPLFRRLAARLVDKRP